jgi:hypothetical protein
MTMAPVEERHAREQRTEPLNLDVDIYGLLGITPDATPGLARQLYWARVERRREAEERGETDGVPTLDELNAALTIILDDRRRAEYDRAYRRAHERVGRSAQSQDRARTFHAGVVVGIMLVTIAAVLIVAWQAEPLAAAATAGAGMIALVASAALVRRDPIGGRSPFIVLGLTEDADAREVDIAYETIAQELLTRVKYDRNAIWRLELLDQGYLRAGRILLERSGALKPARPSLPVRVLRGAGRLALVPIVFFVGALGSVALAMVRGLGRLTARAAAAASGAVRRTSARGVRLTAEQFSALSHHVQGDGYEEPLPDLSIDLDRRLALGFRTVAERAAEARAALETEALQEDELEQAPAALPRRAEALVEAYLVLEAAAGRRRVPITTAPLRIGSGPACDLALPADLGLAPEHALVWQRDGALLMHVIDPRAGASLVNDVPMTWASLEDGDAIHLGDARFHVEAP